MLFVVNVQKYLHPKPEAQRILSGLGCGKFELINGKIDKKKYSDHLPLKFEIMEE